MSEHEELKVTLKLKLPSALAKSRERDRIRTKAKAGERNAHQHGGNGREATTAQSPHHHYASNAEALPKKKSAPSGPAVATTAALNTAKKVLIGAKGGIALKELLSTAPNPEEAIRDFQAKYGFSLDPNRHEQQHSQEISTATPPALELLDLLHCKRHFVYNSLLTRLKDELCLRIQEFSQVELQKLLEVTFPYIEFRELRAIPIAILSRQEDTPELYLRELTENRRILKELPVHVRRRIMHVEPSELRLFVDECTQEYVEENIEWYRLQKHHALVHTFFGDGNAHDATASSTSLASAGGSTTGGNSVTSGSAMAFDSWGSPSTRGMFGASQMKLGKSQERRKHSKALAKLSEMIGDSEKLYLATLEILKDYIVSANIPGSNVANINPKHYVDYVPFLGALRCDLANIQRDKTTSLLRTDPFHKFIWFLDRGIKNGSLENAQLSEVLGVIKKLRIGDLATKNPTIKKRNSQEEDEEEHYEVVMGPPPADELLQLLDKISKVDARMIFAEPVPEGVPNYREIIKEPMDLSTMKMKARKNKYKSLEAFRRDFDVMIHNCLTFNPESTIFHKEAKRISKKGHELMDKHADTLRGSPQKIRAKKRRKTSPSHAANTDDDPLSMLSSEDVVNYKDFLNVDHSGMVPEGICEEALVDLMVILCDPLVKQMLCEMLLKCVLDCAHRQVLPTDDACCRGCVQLLQVGNASSVRRMLRRQDFVLRSPLVSVLRMALPLVARIMIHLNEAKANGVLNSSSNSSSNSQNRTSNSNNSGSNSGDPATSGGGSAALKSGPTPHEVMEALADDVLWESVVNTNSTTRSVIKTYLIQCLVNGFVEVAHQLLGHLVAVEEDLIVRDRFFLDALSEAVVEALSKQSSTTTTLSSGTNTPMVASASTTPTSTTAAAAAAAAAASSRPAEVSTNAMWTKSLIWKYFVEMFLVHLLAKKTREAVAQGEVVYIEGDSVVFFPVQALHAKVVSVLALGVQANSLETSVVRKYLEQTLWVLRLGCTLEQFQALWESPVFQFCRQRYELLLEKTQSTLSTRLFEKVEEQTEPDATAELATQSLAQEEDSVKPSKENAKQEQDIVNACDERQEQVRSTSASHQRAEADEEEEEAEEGEEHEEGEEQEQEQTEEDDVEMRTDA